MEWLESARESGWVGTIYWRIPGWWIEGDNLAKEFKFPFFEVSAKEGTDVENGLNELVRQVRRARDEKEEKAKVEVEAETRQEEEAKKKSPGCLGRCVVMWVRDGGELFFHPSRGVVGVTCLRYTNTLLMSYDFWIYYHYC
jgi:hypothetical protein